MSGDYQLGQTVRVRVTTNALDGSPADPTTPIDTGDFRLIKNDNTEKPSANGLTYTAQGVGVGTLAIDTGNTVDAGYFAEKADFSVILDLQGKTLQGTAIRSFLQNGHFSIANRAASIAIGDTVPVEHTRQSDVLTVGDQGATTSANTLVRDGTYWQITSAAAGIDAELVFNIGTDGSENPSNVQLFGRFDSGKDRITIVQAYNFAVAAWEKLGQDVLENENSDKAYIFGLGRSYVRRGQAGTPGSDGDVRIRFLYDTSVSNKVSAGDNLYLDKVAVFATSEAITTGEIVAALIESNPQRNYPHSAIHVNLENGQPGQKYGVNGTPGRPSSNLTDAIALANIAGFSKFIIEANTSIILDQALPDWEFQLAPAAVVDLNGQNVDNSRFIGGTLQGAAVATNSGIECIGSTLKGIQAWGIFDGCRLPVSDSVIATGNQLFFLDCRSLRPGAANPSIKGGGQASLNVSVLDYAGGIDIAGLTDNAEVTVNGKGSVAFNDPSVVNVAPRVAGNMRRTGTLPTGMNLIDLARIDQDSIWHRIRNDSNPPNGSYGWFLDTPISSITGGIQIASIPWFGATTARRIGGIPGTSGETYYAYAINARGADAGLVRNFSTMRWEVFNPATPEQYRKFLTPDAGLPSAFVLDLTAELSPTDVAHWHMLRRVGPTPDADADWPPVQRGQIGVHNTNQTDQDRIPASRTIEFVRKPAGGLIGNQVGGVQQGEALPFAFEFAHDMREVDAQRIQSIEGVEHVGGTGQLTLEEVGIQETRAILSITGNTINDNGPYPVNVQVQYDSGGFASGTAELVVNAKTL